MKFGEWEFRWRTNIYTAFIEVMLFRQGLNGTEFLQPNGESLLVKEGEAAKEPSFTLRPEQVQVFMDGLWEMGMRPKDRRYETEITLLQKHLDDMRKLIFERRIR